ncbi:MAG: hypothetical protein ABIJ26_01420 [Candidatus Margulisiibacteriota bacterium]
MALETLKDVKTIGGFDVEEIPCVSPAHEGAFIKVCHGSNSIEFRIQNGPIKENGVNGCQVDTMIVAALLIIKGLHKRFPCWENALAIIKLKEALLWLGARKANREARGVEGENKS